MERTTPARQSASRLRVYFGASRRLFACVSVALVATLACYGDKAIDEEPAPIEVSMFELLANPARYRDRAVSFYGFGVFEFEESAIYLSKMHAEYMDVASRVPVADDTDHRELNGRVVRIEATLRVDDVHPGGYLDSTRRIVATEKVRTFELRENHAK